MDVSENIPEEQGLNSIHATVVTLEVVDSKTGRIFKRTLPLEYLENSNGILLKGEDISGRPSQISFLSEFALQKTLDIIGRGSDSPHHSHDGEGNGHSE
jgi:hypothetical protein